jgi:hypothetical protein
MFRKVLKAIGWTAAGLVGLVVLLYLAALAINWRDREPSAAAKHLTELSRGRPPIADSDNGYLFLRGWELEGDRREQLPTRIREFLGTCHPGLQGCAGAFDGSDGLLDEWYAVEGSVLDRYLELTALSGWREEGFNAESIPRYAGAADGQKMLLLRARELAKEGDAEGVRALLERDLRFWRIVLQSSDILVSKMMATAMLNRHFEWGNLVLRTLSSTKLAAAIPTGWRTEISQAERSMERCIAGEWLFAAEMSRGVPEDAFGVAAEFPIVRHATWLIRPLYQQQDTLNHYAEHYWTAAHAFEVPLHDYPSAVAGVQSDAQKRVGNLFPFGGIYNLPGGWLVAMTLLSTDITSFAVRVGDVEGLRRAALAAATLRASGVGAKDVSAALANAEQRDPYTNQQFVWDEASQSIVFTGLQSGERGEHRIYY